MSKALTISDDLAKLVEARRVADGRASLDEAAEDLIARGLIADSQEDHSAGRDDEALRAMIDEAEASGPPSAWDAVAARAEVLQRYARRQSAPR